MAKTFVVFDAAVGALLNGDLNASDTYRMYLMSAGWTPDYGTSTIASMTAQFVTKLSGSWSEGRAVGLCGMTRSAAGVWKFDCSATGSTQFTASSGTNICAQYAILAVSAGGAHAAGNPPLGYWEVSTAEVVATQINIDHPAGGFFDTSAADKTV